MQLLTEVHYAHVAILRHADKRLVGLERKTWRVFGSSVGRESTAVACNGEDEGLSCVASVLKREPLKTGM
jgi:hypothetical protein